MEMFCRRCGSIMLWDFTGGRRIKKCSNCGLLDEPDPSEKGIPSVRKGVSPRGSNHAKRTLAAASGERDPQEERTGISTGRKAPAMFPFKTVRNGQYEFMIDVKEAVEGGGFLLANVPTGIGKTAGVLSPAVEFALKNKKMVAFLTSKQSQHRIAVETLRRLSSRSGKRIRVVDIVSKQSMCPREVSSYPHYYFNFLCKGYQRDGTCPFYRAPPHDLLRTIRNNMMDVSELREAAVQRRICPHRAALEAAREADVLICDFNYLFSDLSEHVLSGIAKDLSDLIVVVDEAHNLPDRIRAHLSQELPFSIIEEALVESRTKRKLRVHMRSLADYIEAEAKGALGDGNEGTLNKREFISGILGLFRGGIDGGFDIDALLGMLKEEGKKRSTEEGDHPFVQIQQFLEGLLSVRESHILFARIREGKGFDSGRIIFRNLDPGEISGPVFKRCHSAVLMSGTLSPPSMFGDVLGMAGGRRREREYASPFPPENRLVLIEPTVSSAYTKRGDGMYSRIAKRIEIFSGLCPGNGAAFFPSYSFMASVRERTGAVKKTLLVEEREMGRARKETLLRDLEREKNRGGALLFGVMGGSLSEGVDYPDNLLSIVMIVGIPFAPPSLEVKALREHYRAKFGYAKGEDYAYLYPALNRTLQAAGRSVRSEIDRSVILLMDERFSSPRYMKFLPPEMKASGIGGGGLEKEISRFFS